MEFNIFIKLSCSHIESLNHRALRKICLVRNRKRIGSKSNLVWHKNSFIVQDVPRSECQKLSIGFSLSTRRNATI